MDSEIGIKWGGLAQQAQEGLQSGAVGVCGIELDSGGKYSRWMERSSLFLSCSAGSDWRSFASAARFLS